MTDRKTRNKFRRIYSETAGNNQPSPQRDLYSKYMAQHMPNASKEKAEKWAQHFQRGSHWHKLSPENTSKLLKTMTQPVDGTAKEIRPKTLEKAANEVKN